MAKTKHKTKAKAGATPKKDEVLRTETFDLTVDPLPRVESLDTVLPLSTWSLEEGRRRGYCK